MRINIGGSLDFILLLQGEREIYIYMYVRSLTREKLAVW